MAYQATTSLPPRILPQVPAISGSAAATHALLRIGAGLLFLPHGLQKLFGLFGGFGGTPGATAPLQSLMGVAGILETVGGLMLISGLFTRAVATVLAAEMVSAFFIAHVPNGPWPLLNGGELPLLYALVFAFLVGHGAGPLSIDSRMEKRSTPEMAMRGD